MLPSDTVREIEDQILLLNSSSAKVLWQHLDNRDRVSAGCSHWKEAKTHPAMGEVDAE
jgi:hypothetical protein